MHYKKWTLRSGHYGETLQRVGTTKSGYYKEWTLQKVNTTKRILEILLRSVLHRVLQRVDIIKSGYYKEDTSTQWILQRVDITKSGYYKEWTLVQRGHYKVYYKVDTTNTQQY